jgi:retinol dehydrogenase 14
MVRTILVTGATSGIGLAAAVELGRRGHRLVLAGRDPERTRAAVEQVKAAGGKDVESVLADFASLASVRAMAQEYRSRVGRLDVLLNNAGSVFAGRTVTVDGLESTFAVNHLAPYLLTRLLLDLLEASGTPGAAARIVNVSSAAHYRATLDFDDLGYQRGGYSVTGAYGRSKLANVLFTAELARRLAGRPVTATSLHPGGVDTNIWSKLPWWISPVAKVLARVAMDTAEQGGARLVYLADSPEVEGVTGKYFHDKAARPPSALAQDEAVARRLWDESARLVGLTTPA